MYLKTILLNKHTFGFNQDSKHGIKKKINAENALLKFYSSLKKKIKCYLLQESKNNAHQFK